MSFKPQLITARTRIGEWTFVGFASADAPLAYHPTLLYDYAQGEQRTSATEWSITHIPTGRELPFRFPSYERCERFITLIAHICNWKVLHSEISGGHRAKKRMRVILMRYCYMAEQAYERGESEAVA